MKAKDLFNLIVESAKSFGCNEKNKDSAKGNAIIRNNIKSFSDGSEYFGFISPDEDYSGAYSDFSFVIFPQEESGHCVIALGVGSLGFKNDLSLASLPGLRRSYMHLCDNNGLSFLKTSFLDIETPSNDLLNKVSDICPALTSVIGKYKTVLSASRIVNPDTEDGLNIIKAWLAKYADYRGWATNTNTRKAIAKALKGYRKQENTSHENNIMELLNKRKFVVIQGAPGTGKTYTSLKIAQEYNKVFFEQFHAETTYSDFVYGIKPVLNSNTPKYEANKGILYESIVAALEKPEQKVLLIIDEINRANLSNVLGPVFYLFEYQSEIRTNTIKIGDKSLTNLPQNLYVLATMNTADRSLAVVDFALRRRFAWYTITPHTIKVGNEQMFHEDLFMRFNAIFEKYASDDELNLQPGQSYFITRTENAKEEMKSRMIYELMPLIKEYLSEGFMVKATNEFSQLFYEETEKQMYL